MFNFRLPLLLLLVLPVLFAGPGCNDAEPQPSFLEIEGIRFTTSPSQGSASQNITELWVFADNVFLGAYDIPARVPLLNAGTTEIRVEFGVRQNGIAQVPEIYEFYAPVSRTVDLIPGETTNLGTLDVVYRNDINFALLEDFESSRQRVFTDLLVGTATLEASDENVFEGAASGRIELTSDLPSVEIATLADFTGLITGFANVWLEVDVLAQGPVVWGVAGNVPGSGLQRFYGPGSLPNTEWTKIYFNLTQTIFNSDLDTYSFALNAFINPTELETGLIFLDNLKVLYF